MQNDPNRAAAEAMSDKTATIEEASALDFEPWSKDYDCEDAFTPPSNEEWSELGRTELPYVRLAFLTMFKTKAELVEMFASDPDMMMRVADDWMSSAETFEKIGRVKALLDGAHSRMMVAASIVAMRETTP